MPTFEFSAQSGVSGSQKENLFQNLGAKIKVVGIGGAGGNAVNSMIDENIGGVEFIAINSDFQDLQQSKAQRIIQIGKNIAKGLGVGGDPVLGSDCAKADQNDIMEAVQGADMVFVTAGMGGGTGTGASPVVAKLARESGALTIAIVTKPFEFEAEKRLVQAEQGIKDLTQEVDSIIVIPNDKLNEVQQITGILESFKAADNVLARAVRGIADIIVGSGFINVDFADVKKIMQESGGKALMGTGDGEGTSRAVEAAENAITSPLLEDISIDGSTGILINVTASSNFTIDELNEACNHIKAKASSDVELIFGLVIDETMGEKVRITVIATGIDGSMKRPVREMPVEEVEEDKHQVSFNLESAIDDETLSDEHASNGNGDSNDLDDHHPLGDDEHFEIPAFIRKPKK
ncbi:MAG: cell division protein FtsZ [Spirochaetales bacterium]|nr:cell division protein FtsZ [Spirochaetales bacterium]|tara:strand:- start:4110 stop:5324 length:1215 start_codon:yes stop_codon:yes gene_type:complete